MHRILSGLICLVLASLACTLSLEDIPTLTPIPPTFTPQPSLTPTATVPIATSTITPTLAPPTPTFTLAPSTATITLTPFPTSTPLPSIGLAYDQLTSIEVDPILANGLNQSWISFRNINDRAETTDVRTPQSDTGYQTIYLARPETAAQVRVLDIPASVGDNIYWSPTGEYLLYFLREGPGVTANETGLYLVNFNLGVKVRFFEMNTLQPRGIAGHSPQWSPDGSRFLVVLPNEYTTDIFVVAVDGSEFLNVTNSPTYDFWASWSPDGSKIAFVSDRIACPTWLPNTPNTCDTPNAAPPTGGHLHLLDVATRQVTKVNDTWVSGAPQWVDERHIAVTSGSLDPLASTSELWLYDVEAGSSWMVTPQDGALYNAASWSPDVQQVSYQRADNSTSLIIAGRLGGLIEELSDYSFPRYGVSMDWSPDGNFLAIGGTNGQCAYGLIVLNTNYQLINSPSTTLLACDPIYSPDARYLGFMGIRASTSTSDARQDLYVASLNGLSVVNLTRTAQGQIYALGWVGPRLDE